MHIVNKQLSLIRWDEIGPKRIALKLERCAIKHRNMKKSLDEIFSVCVEKSPYAAILLYERLECLFGKDDAELINLKKYLSPSDDFFAAIKLRDKEKARRIFQNFEILDSDDSFYKDVIEMLKDSKSITEDICFILNCSTYGHEENIEKLSKIINKEFSLPSDNVQRNSDLKEYILYAVHSQNISLFFRLLYLFDGLDLLELTNTKIEMWRDLTLSCYQPYSMFVYRKILLNLKMADDEISAELRHFLADKDDTSEKAWNNYVFLGYEIANHPELTQKLIEETELPAPNVLPNFGTRLMVYRETVEKTFWILTKQNPVEAFHYIDILGIVNLANFSFQNDANWGYMRQDNHLRESDYIEFVKKIIASRLYTPQQLIDYYMNSPLRYYVYIDLFLDLVFQGDEYPNVIELNELFSSYTLLGSFFHEMHFKRFERSNFVYLKNIRFAGRKYLANSHDAAIVKILESKENGDAIAVRPSVFLKINHYCKVNYLVKESEQLNIPHKI